MVAQQPRPMPYVAAAAIQVLSEAASDRAAGCSMLPRQEFKVNYEVRPEEAGFQPKERNTIIHRLLLKAIDKTWLWRIRLLPKKEEVQREKPMNSRDQAFSQRGKMWRIEGTRRRMGGNRLPAKGNLSDKGSPIRLVCSVFSING